MEFCYIYRAYLGAEWTYGALGFCSLRYAFALLALIGVVDEVGRMFGIRVRQTFLLAGDCSHIARWFRRCRLATS